jgi:alpha-N-arabinofuranosidase
MPGISLRTAVGEALTASRIDAVNTFDAPDTVVPRSFSAQVPGYSAVQRVLAA